MTKPLQPVLPTEGTVGLVRWDALPLSTTKETARFAEPLLNV
jgi:hypothetical protein